MMAHEEEPLRPVTVSELIDTQRKRQIAKLRLSGKESGLMTIALITFNITLVPLIEGL